ALARALAALVDARARAVAVVAIGIGNVFGGTSVLGCATDRFALLPGTRLGLSGPKVLESIHGKWQLDADDPRDVDAVFGAKARSDAGFVDLVVDDPDAIRAWIASAVRDRERHLESAVTAVHRRLAKRIEGDVVHAPPFASLPCFAGAVPVDRRERLFRSAHCWLTRPSRGAAIGPADAHAVDEALLAYVVPLADKRTTLVLVEDSAGHAITRAAEMKLISQFLAHHACVLGLLRSRGARLVGLLAGIGHSAAFFVNALQAPNVYALPDTRVIAMDPSAVSRVTGIASDALGDDDPLLGQPVRHFAAQGGAAIVGEATFDALRISGFNPGRRPRPTSRARADRGSRSMRDRRAPAR
ncbi:MAG TPA: biotin-independent malonate decarboxylase subunit gamma, partial [Casimicrobiaceae bacterium]|nr:biotin-independent malonate decarboxylase subunit gamma [Casimicrobiaceae bacterium]